jgi:HK97 family phage major capsid protein
MPIPQTPAEMQELMDDTKRLANWISEGGQLSELTKAYAKATDERGEMSELVTNAVKAAMVGRGEIAEIVNKEAGEIVAKLLADRGVNRPDMGGLGAKSAATANPLAAGVPMDDIGFTNIGDFTRTVFGRGKAGDERVVKAQEVMNAYSSYDPSTGGFLLPETFRSEIYDLVLEQSIVRPRASVITMGPGKQVLPYVDQTTHVGSVFGGMAFQRVPESGTVTPTEAKFGRVVLEATKLMGTARVPNELWANAASLSTWLMAAMPRGIAFFEDLDFISGLGGGSGPLGFTKSPALITITKETNQVASTILVENILKIYARTLPQSIGNSVWLANPTTFPQLATLSIAVGTGGSAVFLMDIHATPNMTLLGRPVIFTEKVPALGAANCIGLYDLGMYLVGDAQAISLETSTEARFENDETSLKVIARNDGRPWIQSALTPANGDSLSPFVALGAVA